MEKLENFVSKSFTGAALRREPPASFSVHDLLASSSSSSSRVTSGVATVASVDDSEDGLGFSSDEDCGLEEARRGGGGGCGGGGPRGRGPSPPPGDTRLSPGREPAVARRAAPPSPGQPGKRVFLPIFLKIVEHQGKRGSYLRV